MGKKSGKLDPIAEYTRERIAQWEASGRTLRALAELAGVAPSFPSQVKAGDSGVGGGSAVKFAKAFDVPFPEYTRLAYEWWETTGRTRAAAVAPLRPTEPDDRYPNRARAVIAARALGKSEQAISDVQAMALRADTDPSPEWWFEQIVTIDRRLADPFLSSGPPGKRVTPGGDF